MIRDRHRIRAVLIDLQQATVRCAKKICRETGRTAQPIA
jgi:hypothetical protein